MLKHCEKQIAQTISDPEEVMDTTNMEGVYEEDENYRQPIATSTPAPNHPRFGAHLKSDVIPLLEDLTDINEGKEETFSVSTDFYKKKLRLKVKKCKSLPKLLVILTNNKSTIDSKGKEKFEHCLRKVKRLKKKGREVELDEKEKLLKKAKKILVKELSLELDEKPVPVKQNKKEKPRGIQKNLFVVANKKELRQIISDAAKKQLGMNKVLEKLLQNHGNFEVA